MGVRPVPRFWRLPFIHRVDLRDGVNCELERMWRTALVICFWEIRQLALRTYENPQSVGGTRFECWTSRIRRKISLPNVPLECCVCVCVCARARHYSGSKLWIVVTCHFFIEIFYSVTFIEHQMCCNSLNMKIVFQSVRVRSSRLLVVNM